MFSCCPGPRQCCNCRSSNAEVFCHDCKAAFCNRCFEVNHSGDKMTMHTSHKLEVQLPSTADAGTQIGARQRDDLSCEGCNQASPVKKCNECNTNLCNSCYQESHSNCRKEQTEGLPAREATKQLESTCSQCQEASACVSCIQCHAAFCQKCDMLLHSKGDHTQHIRQTLSKTIARNPTKARQCEQCEAADAALHCESCEILLCDGCDSKLHRARAMRKHTRKALKLQETGHITLSLPKCDQCEEADVTITCPKCELLLCSECDTFLHRKGAQQKHTREPYTREEPNTTSSTRATQCDHCSNHDAVVSCKACQASLCCQCDTDLHHKGVFRKHSRQPIKVDAEPLPGSATQCEQCEQAVATVSCSACLASMCNECDTARHHKGAFKKHVREALVSSPSSSNTCDECGTAATVACKVCQVLLCPKCDTKLHQTGAFLRHVRVPIETDTGQPPGSRRPQCGTMCMQCGKEAAAILCTICTTQLCLDCDTALHRKGVFSKHRREPLAKPNTSQALPSTIQCEQCEDKPATVSCMQCDASLCQACDKMLHQKGPFQRHIRQPTTMDKLATGVSAHAIRCEDCDRENASLSCSTCDVSLCPECDKKLHSKGPFTKHTRSSIAEATGTAGSSSRPVPANAAPCERCECNGASVSCTSCELSLCSDCDADLHRKGALSKHSREPLKLDPDQGAPSTAQEDQPPTTIQCEHCEEASASLVCSVCDSSFCQECDAKLHSKGAFCRHTRNPITKISDPTSKSHQPLTDTRCEQCKAASASVTCAACEISLCPRCDTELHSKGALSKHQREPLGKPDTNQALPSTTQCEQCEEKPAMVSCSQCDASLCQACDETLHQKGPFGKHIRKPITIDSDSTHATAKTTQCEQCDRAVATLSCSTCDISVCQQCDAKLHGRGAFSKHTRTTVAWPKDSGSPGNRHQPGTANAPLCEHCEEISATVCCQSCQVTLCSDCDADLHRKGALSKHSREPLKLDPDQGAPSTAQEDQPPTTIQCEHCEEAPATMACSVCDSSLCKGCDTELHGKGTFSRHTRNPITKNSDPTSESHQPLTDTTCGQCKAASASVTCAACEISLCPRCDTELHSKGALSKHQREPLGKPDTNQALPSTTHCEQCEEKPAMVSCSQCDASLCQACDETLHQKGPFGKHIRKPITIDPDSTHATAKTTQCEQCDGADATLSCSTCGISVCQQCDAKLHGRGAFSKHTRTTVACPKDSGSPGNRHQPGTANAPLCEHCEEISATVRCQSCQVTLCSDCDADLHRKGALSKHSREPLKLDPDQGAPSTAQEDQPPTTIQCEHCEEASASVVCSACDSSFCQECDAKLHSKGVFSKHTRNPIRSDDRQSHRSHELLTTTKCERCREDCAAVTCEVCEISLCSECDTILHGKGAFIKHHRKPMTQTVSSQPPLSTNERDTPSVAVQCQTCGGAPAIVECSSCEILLCHGCDTKLHSKGVLSKHTRGPISKDSHSSCGSHQPLDTARCEQCGTANAIVTCTVCKLSLCHECDAKLHHMGVFSKHRRVPFEKQDTVQASSPTTRCEECEQSQATLSCSLCDASLCQVCDQKRHQMAPFSTHVRQPIALNPSIVPYRAAQCNQCNKQIATVSCRTCDVSLCQECDLKRHRKGALSKHVRDPLTMSARRQPSATGTCDQCKKDGASSYCQDCQSFLCHGCDTTLHQKDPFSKHSRKPVPEEDGLSLASQCDQCQESAAVVYCSMCQVTLCFGCDRSTHRSGPLSKHIRKPLTEKRNEQPPLAARCEQCTEGSAAVRCLACKVILCTGCDEVMH